MSDSHSDESTQPKHAEDKRISYVEAILMDLFPTKVLFDAAENLWQPKQTLNERPVRTYKDAPTYVEFYARVESKRAELLALSESALRQEHQKLLLGKKAEQELSAANQAARKEQASAKKEAAKFYNQPNAIADFAYWSKMDFWTLEEALALLLGKDPRVVTQKMVRAAIAAEVGLFFIPEDYQPTAVFLRTYETLRSLAARSNAMSGATLEPVSAIEWCLKVDIVKPPVDLVRLLSTTSDSTLSNQGLPDLDAPKSALNKPPSAALKNKGTELKWTPEALTELQAYRELHGTKLAAEHFDITQGRVRQLLPKKKLPPAGYSVFSPTPKTSHSRRK